jgi:serine/threonine-protein kinase
MAVVFEAEHRKLGKRVAIKILQPHAASNAVLRARFEREGRAAVRVQHPNVADVIDVGWENDWPYIVMELVSGPTLAELIRREAPMPVARAMELLLPVVSALRKAHAARVVHRDIKPANILVATELRGNPQPKIVDFGISKIVGNDDAAITREHGVVGSLAYMAPEQLRSASNADERSDQWAVGVVLYECVTGVQPFRGEGSVEVMRAIMEASPAAPSSLRSELRKELDAVILRTLKAEPRDRFLDMRALGAALLRFASPATFAMWARDFETANDPNVTEDDSEAERTPLPDARTLERPQRRVRGPLFVALAVAMVLIVGAGITRGLRLAKAPAESVSSAPPPVTASPAASSVVAIAPPPAVTPSAAPIVLATASASTAPIATPPQKAPPSKPITPSAKVVATVSAASPPPSSAPPAPPPASTAKTSTGTLGSPILE